MFTYVLALVSVLLSVAAQFALKAGVAAMPPAARATSMSGAFELMWSLASQRYLLLGLVLYAVSAVVWLGVLARLEVSKAYPMVGLGFAITVVLGWWVGESVTPLRVAGVLLICLGVALVGRS
jgi:drug/metabolite transporter (DMT)-like permease